MTQEEFYDAKISPLMTQVIALCKEAQIPMVADFALDWSDDEQSHLKCTTALLDEAWEPPAEMVKALEILRPRKTSPMMLTVRDANGDVKEMHAIM